MTKKGTAITRKIMMMIIKSIDDNDKDIHRNINKGREI